MLERGSVGRMSLLRGYAVPTRRQFLARSLSAGLGLGSLAAFGAPPAHKKRWRAAFGLNGFMSSSRRYKQSFPIEEVLAFGHKEGFDGVELVNGWPKGPYPDPDEDEKIAALKALYARHKLQVFSIQTSAGGAFRKSKSDRDRWVRAFARWAKFARKAGCECVGLWPGGGLGGQTLDPAVDNLVSSLKQAARIASGEGLLASVEIEPPFVFRTIDVLIRIVDDVGHPSLKGMYDPSHFDLMNGGKGKPEELLEKLGARRVGYVHLTDSDGTLFGGTSKHLPCGDGHIDIPRSLEILWKGGFDGWIMIDPWLIKDPYDACRKGKKAIDQALARFQRAK